MLNHLVTLIAQFRADEQLTRQTRQQRDRRVGRDLAGLQGKPQAQVLGWLEQVASEQTQKQGDRAEASRKVFSTVLFIIALIAGWGAALAVFYYDGSRPVNVVNVLAIFVFAQILLLLLFLLMTLPPGLARFIPGFDSLQTFLGMFNPGRWLATLARQLPGMKNRGIDLLLSLRQDQASGLHRVIKWLISHWSQWFALGFNLGAIAGALYLVTFTDLAFGWSTTLDVTAAQFHNLAQWLAMPWSGFFPEAVPTLELVQATRYFRLDEGLLNTSQPGQSINPVLLGHWWLFLLMSLLCYGLLPRLMTLIFSHFRLNASTRKTFVRYPGVEALLERLNTPQVTTQAINQADETETAVQAQRTDLSWDEDIVLSGKPFVVIDWSNTLNGESGVQQFISQSNIKLEKGYQAGGRRSLQQDAEVIGDVVGKHPDLNIIVVVKAWEPPMLECVDFLAELKNAAGEKNKIIVIVLTTNNDGAISATSASDLNTWRQSLASLVDSRFTITALTT